MRILIDIGHPAHVHLFKHFVWEMQKKGHVFLFTCRNKEFAIYLLEKYGFRYHSFGRKYNTTAGKLWGLVKFDIMELLVGIKFKPDIFISHGSIYAAHAAFLLRKPHISLEDTGNLEQVRLYLPFTENVLTSDIFPFDYGKKQIRYKAHHELAYLNPKYFIPDENFKSKIGLSNTDKYAILRFVSWNASHDLGQFGIKGETKRELIRLLSENYKVFISSENSLPEEYIKFKIEFSPEDMHDALYFAELFIGEGTTMAMEAAILGTKSFYINSLQYSNVADMESYGLLKVYYRDENLIDDAIRFMRDPGNENSMKNGRNKLLKDKIDLTAFMVWFIENYPESALIMKDNPDYQLKFK